MRQRIKPTGPGVTPEEVAAVLGLTPKRQAMIDEILGLPHREKAPQHGLKQKLAARKTHKQKSASRK